MLDTNPLKDIPFEELKEYCKELGYYLTKKPEKLIKLEKCLCGRQPHHIWDWDRDTDSYVCLNCGMKGPVVLKRMPFNDAVYGPIQVAIRTAHENNNVARKAWNDMIKEKKQWHRKLM